MNNFVLDKNLLDIICTGGNVTGHRPSLYGEKLSEDLEPEPINWRPIHLPFVCPECSRDFGDRADNLGKHLMTAHYPRVPKNKLAHPHKCAGKCGRYLEWNTRYDRSESVAHEKYCNKK